MKSFYRHILVWAVAILSLWEVSSCDNSLSRIPELAKAEHCMEAQPDSALAILQAVDTLQLTTEAQRAKYALLLSMALDKNVIDRTDFNVLQPAIDYYADHGTATDQLRTYYYQGRIYSNAGNNPDALKAFMKATDKVEDSDDTMTKARLYFAQIDIYMALLKFDKAEEVCQIAAEYFKEAGRSKSYANCMVAMINIYTLLGDREKANQYVAIARRLLPQMSPQIKKQFEDNSLIAISNIATKNETIQIAIEKYLKSYNEGNRDELALGNAFLTIGNYDEALKHLMLYPLYSSEEEIRYNILLAQTFEAKGMYKESFEAYRKYVSLNDSMNVALFREDAQFIADRHQLEMQTLQERQTKHLVVVIAVFCILLLCLIFYYRFKSQKRKIAENMLMVSNLRELLKVKTEKSDREKSELQNSLATSTIQSQSLQTAIDQLFEQRFATIDQLCNSYYEYQGTPHEKQKLYKDAMNLVVNLGNDAETLQEVEKFVNTYKDHLMERFRQTFPDLKPQDYQLYLYVVAGFSARAISIFMNEKLDVVYNRKSRLKRKLKTNLTNQDHSFADCL